MKEKVFELNGKEYSAEELFCGCPELSDYFGRVLKKMRGYSRTQKSKEIPFKEYFQREITLFNVFVNVDIIDLSLLFYIRRLSGQYRSTYMRELQRQYRAELAKMSLTSKELKLHDPLEVRSR